MHTTIGMLLTAACSSGHAAAPVSNVASHVPAVALSMEHIAQKMVAAQICQLGAPLRNEKGKTQKRIRAAILKTQKRISQARKQFKRKTTKGSIMCCILVLCELSFFTCPSTLNCILSSITHLRIVIVIIHCLQYHVHLHPGTCLTKGIF